MAETQTSARCAYYLTAMDPICSWIPATTADVAEENVDFGVPTPQTTVSIREHDGVINYGSTISFRVTMSHLDHLWRAKNYIVHYHQKFYDPFAHPTKFISIAPVGVPTSAATLTQTTHRLGTIGGYIPGTVVLRLPERPTTGRKTTLHGEGWIEISPEPVHCACIPPTLKEDCDREM